MLKDSDVQHFIQETCNNFGGITQSNPTAAPPFKGFWKDHPEAEKPIIDRLTYLFGLVPIHEEDEAEKHFTDWKNYFERSAHQDIVLVVYHPVKTIGDFL